MPKFTHLGSDRPGRDSHPGFSESRALAFSTTFHCLPVNRDPENSGQKAQVMARKPCKANGGPLMGWEGFKNREWTLNAMRSSENGAMTPPERAVGEILPEQELLGGLRGERPVWEGFGG